MKLQRLRNMVEETASAFLGIPFRKYAAQHFPKFYAWHPGFKSYSVKKKYMGKDLSSVQLGKYLVNIKVNRLWLVIFSLHSL